MARRRWWTALSAHEWAYDAVLAGLLVAIEISISATLGTPFAMLVALVTCAGVVVRRALPAVALGIVSAGAVLQMALLQPPGVVNIATLVVVYSCAAYGSSRVRLAAGIASAAGAVVAGLYTGLVLARAGSAAGGLLPGDVSVERLLVVSLATGGFAALALAVAWLLGYARLLVLRSREARVAQRIAEVEGERLQERMLVERERARIAREMHDVLAHSLVTIATLSDGARLTMQSDPAAADEALRDLGSVSRTALGDVRRLLSELREEQSAELAHSVEELPELIARFASLGLRVQLHESGEPLPLSESASLAAYRVAQESLTNVLRHGDTSRPVDVTAAWDPSGLRLTVRSAMRTDDAEDAPSLGHGLRGLRERVLLEEGSFLAVRAGEHFVVDATLPSRETSGEEP